MQICGRVSLLFISSLFLISTSAVADLISDTIVHLSCADTEADAMSENKGSKGSGVLVSDDGNILTAKHVVIPIVRTDDGNAEFRGNPYRYCFAKRRTANGSPEKVFLKDKSSLDAALLDYNSDGELDGGKYPFLKFCKLTPNLLRARIFATGFPLQSRSGVPSSRLGIISTTDPTGVDRLIETDSATTRGMSGGMVTLEATPHLIGLIAGAEFDPGTGIPKFYAVLPLNEITDDIALQEAESCTNTREEVFKKLTAFSKNLNFDQANQFADLVHDVIGSFSKDSDHHPKSNFDRFKGLDEKVSLMERPFAFTWEAKVKGKEDKQYIEVYLTKAFKHKLVPTMIKLDGRSLEQDDSGLTATAIEDQLEDLELDDNHKKYRFRASKLLAEFREDVKSRFTETDNFSHRIKLHLKIMLEDGNDISHPDTRTLSLNETDQVYD